jgi:hypothetical protein
VAAGVEDVEDADLGAPGGAGPQFLEVMQVRAGDLVGAGRPRAGPRSASNSIASRTRLALRSSRARYQSWTSGTRMMSQLT